MLCRCSLWNLWIAVLISLLGTPSFIMAQSTLPPDLDILIKKLGSDYKGGSFVYFMQGDSIVVKQTPDPNEAINVIVQLLTPPLAQSLANGIKKQSTTYRARRDAIALEQERIIAALLALEGDLNTTAKKPKIESKVHRQYQIVLNGFAITTSHWMIEHIRKLPGVKSVEKDEEVKVNLDQSVRVIGADSIWSVYGITGQGMVVGILDTGIDYLHPDLGGGIGPGFKVVGGYDFVNNDADPMDDHGHGTHVGGIVAANGILKGVAPGASLMGYKVLSANGVGDHSAIIAAIEQSVMDDVPIINLSLGGSGHADDALCMAIDNASAAGVVCVVAAGNAGSAYMTIGSPGAARSAITVGATHDTDTIAWFSSRGPTRNFFGIKPDLLAPGVEINAPIPNNGYASWNGTSMAAPHVAGAAALLMNKFPDLLPSHVKSILMQSALDCGYNLLTQGAGRVDVMKAFQPPTLIVDPPTLSFGVSNLNDTVWTKTSQIKISNVTDVSRQVNLVFNNSFPAGADVALFPQSFTLLPNQTQEVTLTIAVNNQMVPFQTPEIPSYVSSIMANYDEHQLKIPVSFAKAPWLKLTFDEPPLFIYFFKRGVDYYLESFYSPGQEFNMHFMGEGNYDIFMTYADGNTFNIIEDFEIAGMTTLHVEKQFAKNHIQLYTPDENGVNVTPTGGVEHFYTFKPEGGGWGVFFTDYYRQFFFNERNFSDFSLYSWNWNGTLASGDSRKIYMWGGELDSCFTDVSFFYEPIDIVNYDIEYHGIEDSLTILVVPSLFELIFSFENPDVPPLSYPFSQDLFISPFLGGSSGQIFRINVYEYQNDSLPQTPLHLFYRTPYYLVGKNIGFNLLEFADNPNQHPPGPPVVDIMPYSGKVIKNGLGPPVWNAMLWYRVNMLLIDEVDWVFTNQMRDWKPLSEMPYRIYKNNTLWKSGSDLRQDFHVYPYDGGRIEMFLNFFDECVLEVDHSNYKVHELPGTATSRVMFKPNAYPSTWTLGPRMRLLQIRSDGEVADYIETGKENLVLVDVRMTIEQVAATSNNVLLAVKHEADSLWSYMNLTQAGEHLQAPIPDYWPQGYYSMRITINDTLDRVIEYTLNPGFYKSGVTYQTPQIFTVSGGGSYCEQTSPTGVNVQIAGSELFMLYQLVKDGVNQGSMKRGTGQSITWGDLTQGTYNVKASNGETFFPMHGSALVTAKPLPQVS